MVFCVYCKGGGLVRSIDGLTRYCCGACGGTGSRSTAEVVTYPAGMILHGNLQDIVSGPPVLQVDLLVSLD